MTTALSDADIFAENFKSGFEKLPNARRFSPEQLEVLYGLGYAQAQQEHWDKALAVFAFLSQYGPTRQHYLGGLALCMQKLHRYEDAASIYSLMLVLFPDQLTPSLRIAECQLAQGDISRALATLGSLDRALSDDDPLKVQTRALLDRLGRSTAHQDR